MTGPPTALVLAVFALVYLGMAAGRVPGLKVDRTGVAVLGAIALYAAGAVDAAAIGSAIDWSTLVILLCLMVLSAQFGASGFYDWCAWRIAASAASPTLLLLITVVVAGALSAVLANDIVVFAMTPMLCRALADRGLDPRPFLIGLAGAANAGSAATIIGNPQNIVIGQSGGLDFWAFIAVCGPPALMGLATVFIVTALVWRRALADRPERHRLPAPALDRAALAKACAATATLLVLFATPLPHVTGAVLVAGALLVSRRRETRAMLAVVDWPLLLLFAGLFVVTRALAETGLPAGLLAAAAGHGLTLADPLVTLAVATVGSNTIGNVPAVILILAAAPDLAADTLYALAVFSTLAGNLLLVGSLANIIVAERALVSGYRLGFVDHARCGLPIGVVSLALAWIWLA